MRRSSVISARHRLPRTSRVFHRVMFTIRRRTAEAWIGAGSRKVPGAERRVRSWSGAGRYGRSAGLPDGSFSRERPAVVRRPAAPRLPGLPRRRIFRTGRCGAVVVALLLTRVGRSSFPQAVGRYRRSRVRWRGISPVPVAVTRHRSPASRSAASRAGGRR